jgi:hypothetical protein
MPEDADILLSVDTVAFIFYELSHVIRFSVRRNTGSVERQLLFRQSNSATFTLRSFSYLVSTNRFDLFAVICEILKYKLTAVVCFLLGNSQASEF